MIYVFNSISIFIYAFFCQFITKPDRRRLFIFLCMFQMTLIIGLRYRVGADYLTYQRIYNELANGYLSLSGSRVEPGYRIINIIIGKAGMPFWCLNLFLIALTNIFLGKALLLLIEQYEYLVLAVYLYIALFFFYHSMNMTRQGLAMCAGLYAVANFLIGNKRKSVLTIVLASTIHVCALLYLIILLLRKFELNRKKFAIMFFVTLFLETGIGVIQSILNGTKYAIYFDEYYTKHMQNSTLVNLGVRLSMLFLALIMYKNVEKGEKRNCLYNMIILCTLFQFLTVQSSIFGRVTTFFFLAYIILIPLLIDSNRLIDKKIAYMIVLFISTIYHLVYYSLSWRSVLVNQYQSILNIY